MQSLWVVANCTKGGNARLSISIEFCTKMNSYGENPKMMVMLGPCFSFFLSDVLPSFFLWFVSVFPFSNNPGWRS